MSEFLDSILAETRTSNVVSEQHDTSKINVSDPGPAALPSDGLRAQISVLQGASWDAAEYGISRAAQLEKLEAAYREAVAFERTPEGVAAARAAAERVLAEMRGRAIRRAALDTSGGRVAVMVAGAPPWHGLGVNVKEAVTAAEAQRLAGLNWTVSKRPLSFQHGGAWVEQDEAFAIVRDDTGACLGSVGSRYVPLQNAEGFSFLDSVLACYGARYTSAGAIHGGKKVWMLADLPLSSFQVARGDEVRTYAIFTNPHDGSGKAWCFPTTERVVCGNTFRVATTRDQGKGIGIRHTGSVKGKVEEAKTALRSASEGFREFAAQAEALARVRVPNVNGYVNGVLDAYLPVSAADAAKGAEALARSRVKADISPDDFALCVKMAEKQIRTRDEVWHDIIERFEGERCRVNGIEGSAWAALQAVTEYADYSEEGRKIGTPEARASRRFESVLNGDRDELKQVAYRSALALAN